MPHPITETPGVYESSVDLESGSWTHVRIEVSGVTSEAIGLWVGPGTGAHFRNLFITAR